MTVHPAATSTPGAKGSGFLGIALADSGDRRRAAWLAIVLVLAFAATAPFAARELPAVPTFVPAYDAAVMVLASIAALMLHAQYRDLHERGFLWLACGYLCSALFALLHGLSFPDAFVSGSLFGGTQTTVWLWIFWHGVAPLFVMAYVIAGTVRPGNGAWPLHRIAYPATVALVAVIALALVRLDDRLPRLLANVEYRPITARLVGFTVWTAHLVAIALLIWRTRLRRLLDLWLCVTLLAAVIELALSGMLITARYQLGFYIGRIYGLIGTLVMLALLLRHALLLQARLVRAASALHDSERRYRDLFDSMGEAFYIGEAVTDDDGLIVDLQFLQENPMARRYIGRDIAGRRLSEVVPDFDREWLAIVEEVIRTGRERSLERPSPRVQRYFRYRVFRLKGRQKQVGILFQDIKPRRDAELALRDSEERFRQFGQAASSVLWVRNADTLEMEYVSAAFETICGRRCEEVVGQGFDAWLAMVHPDDREAVRRAMRRVQQGERMEQEYRILHGETGGELWLLGTEFPMRDDDCRINRIGGIAQDATLLKKAQFRLSESEERLRSAIEVGRLATWDWNLTTGEVAWSDEHYRIEGYVPGEVVPSYEAWIARVHPEDREAVEAAVRQAMLTGGEYVREVRFLHPDGGVHWANARGRFFYDAAGRPVRMVGSMIDTTLRREFEDAQRVLVAELQHRTRNLIAVVRSISDRTLRESADMAQFATVFSERLGSLARVQGLLSRLKEGQRVTFDELLRMELAAHLDPNDGTRFELSGPDGVSLRSSSVQPLALAIHELITNAVKYGALKDPAGCLRIAWQVEFEEGRPWLHVDWRETGVVHQSAGNLPPSGGAGRELIERALPYQFGARTRYELTDAGVHCTIAMPISRREMLSPAGHDMRL
ncbi:PAS domain-containing protein [Lysobacter auxotrophicus]|uniref:histidine kinase n=1 Tax=Lysobacter auxotrophicus TaxID=2992573 RepID=A0ABN6UQD6_9GAMM|nr:PAS domain-containing protein [Lysobacter auxotrophicus]BDU17068.1 PAS domain-containing protein [Lysobacter auxotrophicus]